MTHEKRRKVSATLPIEMVQELKRVKNEVGLPVGRQVELALNGYTIEKIHRK